MNTYRIVIEHIETRRQTIDVDAENLADAVHIAERHGTKASTSNERRRVRIRSALDESQVTTESYVVGGREVG